MDTAPLHPRSADTLQTVQTSIEQMSLAMGRYATSVQAALATWAERNRPLIASLIEMETAALSRDAFPHDFAPDLCWRCDAAPSEIDVGLCAACHGDLTSNAT